jgi:antitoxin (DNA-binding transcriptional repressor) of toxin-antitoxin stability system
MSNQVSKSQVKAKALDFFRQAETSGEPLVVTDHGRPTLELRRYQPPTRTPLDARRGSVLRHDAPTEPIGGEDWDALR